MKNQTITFVDPNLIIERDKFNPRIKPKFDDLLASIRHYGVRDAVGVEKTLDGYLLNAQGHRRLLAVKSLIADGVTTTEDGQPLLFPVKIVEHTDDMESLRLDIVTLNTGKPLEMLEEAHVYEAVMATVPEGDEKARIEKIKLIENKTGKSYNAIYNLVNLLEATKTTHKLIETGKISASLVIEMWLKGDAKGNWDKVEEAVIEAVAKAAEKGKTKATKKDTKDGSEPKETKAEKEAREEEEKQTEADKVALKSRNKELADTEKRAGRFFDTAIPLAKVEAKGFERAVADYPVMLASYLYPHGRDGEGKKIVDGDISFGDTNASYKAMVRAHYASVKEAVDVAKLVAKTELDEFKAKAKADMDELKVKLAEKVEELKAKATEKEAALKEKLAAARSK